MALFLLKIDKLNYYKNMKKIILAITLLITFNTFAQDAPKVVKQNEITSNLFDLVISGSFNVGYERLYEGNQSLKIDATFFDTYGYIDAGYIEKSNAISLKAAYLIYFSKTKDHYGFLFYPQLKLRTGEVTTDFYYGGNGMDDDFSYDVGGFSAGFGIGHKWIFNDKFTLTINGEIARNLGNFDSDYLGEVEGRFGVNFGVRF